MLLGFLAFLLSLQGVFAQFYIEIEEKTYRPGDKVNVTWTELDTVDVSNQKYAQLWLCSCFDGKFGCKDIGLDGFNPQKKKSIEIDVSNISSHFPDGPYMVQLHTQISQIGSAVYTLAYSTTWFQLAGMSGSGTAGKGCTVPYGQNVGFDTSSSVSWSWTMPAKYSSDPCEIPYSLQNGPTRYACAQPTPGELVTVKTTPTRRYPTSSVSRRSTYFINPYLPVTTTTKAGKNVMQYTNYAASIATTPTGRKPTPVLASFSSPTASSSAGSRRRRWANF